MLKKTNRDGDIVHEDGYVEPYSGFREAEPEFLASREGGSLPTEDNLHYFARPTAHIPRGQPLMQLAKELLEWARSKMASIAVENHLRRERPRLEGGPLADDTFAIFGYRTALEFSELAWKDRLLQLLTDMDHQASSKYEMANYVREAGGPGAKKRAAILEAQAVIYQAVRHRLRDEMQDAGVEA
jgi:hypothetical protein